MKRFWIGAPLVLAMTLLPSSTPAKAMSCRIRFSLSGWSAFYKTARGHGEVSCDNGQSTPVVIRVKGGGPTVGETKVVDGTGRFSPVSQMRDVFGAYGTVEAHAGAGASADAQILMKKDVSLALAGKGDGVNLGVSFGKFVISSVRGRRRPAR